MIQVVNREPAARQAGRVKLTLDDGTVMEGVLEMDDGASPEGTPWNAQTGRLLQADIRTYPAAMAITAGDVVDISNGQATTDGTPSQGIALQTVQAGADVDVIFSGATYAAWVEAEQEILSGGVRGYSPEDGFLVVIPETLMGKIVYGSYTGNSSNSARTINLGAEPKVVIIIRSSDNYEFLGFSTIVIARGMTYNAQTSSSGSSAVALKIVSNGFQVQQRYYFSGSVQVWAEPAVNEDGYNYTYIAIF